jgi:hypothetical protein
VETVNRLAPTQMVVKPGSIVLGLVMDTLTGRSPLYRLVEFHEGRDTELLLGERVPASAFNDDTAGRLLDLLKDHRPDLKQFLISTLCVGDKIPIFGKNEDGKRSDREIHNTTLSQISEHMARFGVEEKAFIHIADSALVTPKSLKELSEGQPFITRLPASYAE